MRSRPQAMSGPEAAVYYAELMEQRRVGPPHIAHEWAALTCAEQDDVRAWFAVHNAAGGRSSSRAEAPVAPSE